ncbi:hypothetical protein ACFW04_013647 [Cataglyphis niger]
MSEDYVRRFGMIQGQKKAYAQINTMLCAEGKTMEVSVKQYEQLNDKQKEIIDLILNRLNNNNHNNNCFYIDGLGGSGKTFTYITIYHLTKIRNKHVCTMAFTSIETTLLLVGKTIHKTFRLSIVDRTLQDIVNNNLHFVEKIIVLSGDFRQFLLIKIHDTRCEIVNLFIKFSPNWKHFIKETEFAKFLLDLGNGILNDSNDNVQLPDCCIAPISTDIVEGIYEFNKMAKCAILSARNADIEEINKRVVELLDISEERIYTNLYR